MVQPIRVPTWVFKALVGWLTAPCNYSSGHLIPFFLAGLCVYLHSLTSSSKQSPIPHMILSKSIANTYENQKFSLSLCVQLWKHLTLPFDFHCSGLNISSSLFPICLEYSTIYCGEGKKYNQIFPPDNI